MTIEGTQPEQTEEWKRGYARGPQTPPLTWWQLRDRSPDFLAGYNQALAEIDQGAWELYCWRHGIEPS